MIFIEKLLSLLGPLTVLSLLFGVIATASATLFLKGDRELFITRIAAISFSTSCISTFLCGILLVVSRIPMISVLHLHVGLSHHHYFEFNLRLDPLAVPFVFVATLLCGTVGAFSRSYLHRDPGHRRFFFLTLLFALGMEIIFMAASLEVLFVGWEIIGLTSALLISFFSTRPATAENALKAFWAYRISDTALLLSAMLFAVAGIQSSLIGFEQTMPPPDTLLGVILPGLIILAALPKSAQVPFSTWLPRAMEGPTPSSAIFYGGLSVHAGLYLVLRMQHHFHMPTWYFITIASIGILSAVYGYTLSRIQTDIKGFLAYSSIMHVGLMFFETGIGLPILAVTHFVGHAFLRTYQILNSGSLIHESRLLVNETAIRHSTIRFFPKSIQEKLYAIAFDLSLRNGSEPNSLVSRIERVSHFFAALEQSYAERVSNLVTILLSRLTRSSHPRSTPNDTKASQ